MKKYYITCGDKKVVILGHNDLHACTLAFKKMFANLVDGDVLGSLFFVSQRGFDSHTDDIVYSAESIMSLVHDSNNCLVEGDDDDNADDFYHMP